MKKTYPYIFFLISLVIMVYFWDMIKIPYDQSNLIQGEFFLKKYNPNNETLRFLSFVFIPLFVFLISYLNFLKLETLSLNPLSEHFFLKKKFKKL